MARRRCPSVNCSAVLFKELKKPGVLITRGRHAGLNEGELLLEFIFAGE